MIEYIIPLLETFLRFDFLRFWFFPLIGLGFLASFPRIVRRFFEWR